MMITQKDKELWARAVKLLVEQENCCNYCLLMWYCKVEKNSPHTVDRMYVILPTNGSRNLFACKICRKLMGYKDMDQCPCDYFGPEEAKQIARKVIKEILGE